MIIVGARLLTVDENDVTNCQHQSKSSPLNGITKMRPFGQIDLAILTAREFAAIQDQALDELGLGLRRGTYIYGLLRRGVRGVRGPGVPEIAFDEKSGLCSDSFLDRLSGELKTELAGVLDDLNTVGPETGKASES